MRLGLWQGPSPAGDIAVGVAALERAIAAAGAVGAQYLVAPEVYLPGYNQPDIAGTAVPRTDPVLQRLAACCAKSGCGVVVGYAEREAESIWNAAIAIDATGHEAAHYRKIQLFGAREKAIYRAGSSYTTFDLAGQKAALLICYDIEFAPHVAALAALGTSVILVPTANMQPFTHVGHHTVAAMAANHGVAIVYANYCGIEGDLTYVGGSLIAGPHGEVLAQAGQGPALLIADIPDRDPALLSTQAADFRKVD